MKFEKLVKILSEAKNEQPGARFYSVQNREGPAGIVSGPIGKSDNFELQKNLDRWEYNPSQNKGKSGFSDESKIWKSMLTSFRLLFNDPYFDKQVQKITKRFNDSRDSYKNIRGIGSEGGIEKYDEENQLEKLERNQTKYRSDLTGMRDELDRMNKIINRTQLPPSEKNKMEIDISTIEAEINTLNLQKSRAKSEKQKVKIEQTVNELATILNKKRDRYDQAMMKPVDVEKIKAKVFDIGEKMDKWNDKLEKTTEELELLYARINQINETNENADSVAKNGFLDLIKFTAGGLAKEYETKVGEIANTSPDQVDWNNPIETLLDAVNRLKALASDDENINPILGYLARFERDYRDKEFDTGRALDKNVNITTMRDFNKLPFMVLSRIYSSLRSSDKSPIPLDKLDTAQSDATQGELITLLDKISPNNEESKAEWTNPNTKTYIKGLIDQLLMSNFSKEQMKKRVDRPWLVDRGKTPSALLKLNIENETSTKNESFDDYFDNLMLEMAFDEDDYKTDLIEVLEKCTKATKKTSSDRKGKKWMKCAKQPDGSYKKIHFGQKGVRVGGGNSKRAKAFRSRHSCSDAKPGSAKKLSCDNWK